MSTGSPPAGAHRIDGLLRGRRICVIGASGFIGRPTVRRLLHEGAHVAALALEPPEPDPGIIRSVVGDVADPEVVASAVAGCDTVIFLASASVPASSNDDMAGEVRRSVEVPVNAAQIASAAGAQRFIFASSGGTVYGDQLQLPIPETAAARPITAYGVSKLAVENYLGVLMRLRRLQTLALRISNPFGEHQPAGRSQGFIATAVRAALAGEPISVWGDGSVTRDYLHVSDVATAFAAACVHNGGEGVINIGSGEGRDLLSVIAAIEEATSRRIDVRMEPGRAVDVGANVLDIRRARACLGWSPKVRFSEGLALTAKWWDAQLNAATTP